MRISDWSSDVCSSDLFPPQSRRHRSAVRRPRGGPSTENPDEWRQRPCRGTKAHAAPRPIADPGRAAFPPCRSEEHTSELQSLMRISYAVFCLKKKKKNHTT